MNIIISVLAFFITSKYLTYLIIAFLGLFVLYYGINKKINIPNTKNFFYLVIAFGLYALISMINGNFEIKIFLYPIIMYFTGSVFYKTHPDCKTIEKNINFIACGLLIHAILNYFTNLETTNRNIIDILTKNSLSATLQATFVVITLSTSFINIQKSRMIKKIILMFSTVMSLLFLMQIGNRTGLIIFFIVFIVSVFLFILYGDNSYINKKKSFKTLIILCIIIIVCIYLYNNNLFKIKDIVENSNLYMRITKEKTKDADQVRFENQLIGIKSLINNPFGTLDDIGKSGYAHNMWLDFGKDAGIFPIIFLIMYSCGCIKTLIGINKSKQFSREYKIFLDSLYLGVYINCLVEPILQAVPFFFGMFVFINAMVDRQFCDIKKTESKQIYNNTVDKSNSINLKNKIDITIERNEKI